MVSLSMTLSDPTRILTASRGFVSDSWAFLFYLSVCLSMSRITLKLVDELREIFGRVRLISTKIIDNAYRGDLDSD